MTARIRNLCILGLLLAAAAAAQSDRHEALLSAWERVIQSDPATARFEKIEPRRYRFRSTLFPFDGEVRVLNVLIDDTFAASDTSFQPGSIEVEFVGLPDATRQKYALSIAHWQKNSFLYFDQSSAKWLSTREFAARPPVPSAPAEGAACRPGRLASNGTTIALALAALAVILFLLLLIPAQRRAARYYANLERSFETAERNAKINEDNHRLLGEILAALKGKNPSP